MLEKILKTFKRGAGITLLSGSLIAYSFFGCEEKPNEVQVEPVVEQSIPVTFFDNTNVRWTAYAPSNFNPLTQSFPTEQSIIQDLELLQKHNYDALFTYGSDNILGEVPRIAKNLGFDHVVMGIWALDSQEEWNNAVSAKEFVDGYCIGNEGIQFGRYSIDDITAKVKTLREETNKPVTTTEGISSYNNQLIELVDWIFPTTHPYWSGITDPNNAAVWTAEKYNDLASSSEKIVMLKEVGLPSQGGGNLSEENQNQYYRILEESLQPDATVPFAYFEAFDQYWKDDEPVEPYWGLFDKDRNPKEVSNPQVLYTIVPPRGSNDNLKGRTVNIIPEEYKISTYILVNGNWWIKPYWNNPLTTIKKNSEWIVDITTGGIDTRATRINSYIVTPDYVPKRHVLPDLADEKVISMISVGR